MMDAHAKLSGQINDIQNCVTFETPPVLQMTNDSKAFIECDHYHSMHDVHSMVGRLSIQFLLSVQCFTLENQCSNT